MKAPPSHLTLIVLLSPTSVRWDAIDQLLTPKGCIELLPVQLPLHRCDHHRCHRVATEISDRPTLRHELILDSWTPPAPAVVQRLTSRVSLQHKLPWEGSHPKRTSFCVAILLRAYLNSKQIIQSTQSHRLPFWGQEMSKRFKRIQKLPK